MKWNRDTRTYTVLYSPVFEKLEAEHGIRRRETLGVERETLLDPGRLGTGTQTDLPAPYVDVIRCTGSPRRSTDYGRYLRVEMT